MKRSMKTNILAVFIAVMTACAFLILSAATASAAYNVKSTWVRFSATAGETVDTGDVVCIKDADGYAYEADANDSALRPAVGVIGKGGDSGDTVEIIVIGILSGWSSLSEGTPGYLSETASAVTQSAPTWSQQVAVAISTTEYFFNFSAYLNTSSITSVGVLAGASPIQLEGATADDYETTIAVTDPTADNTVTIPDGSGTQVLSSLSTNKPDAANSVWGVSNGWVYEGATADAYETKVAPTDPTADRTITWPDASGVPMLASAVPGAANSVSGVANGIEAEGSTADAYETTVSFTDPTADRTMTVPDADVNLGAIANSLLANPYSYFTVALSVNGQESTTVDPTATFQMPFAATLVEVSVCARDIDTTDGDETYTVDIEEAGTTVLGSAISIAADNTPVVGTVSDASIADNAKIEAVLTLGGTSPTIDDLTILLTFKVAHSS